MKRLHGLILRMLPGRVLGWLGTLMFLLVMQFLIKYLPDLAGKGLPLGVLLELIAYNLAYMVVLAVPMSLLIGAMMTFGRIAESRAWVVIKASGVSPIRLIWPTLLIGAFVATGMTYFNNRVLPEANFRARNLWYDIRRKRPDFELRSGMFYEGVRGYSILVQHVAAGSGELKDILIYDYTDNAQAVIKAREGRLLPLQDRPELALTLFDGEIHRMPEGQQFFRAEERYERLTFDKYRMTLDASEFAFERSAEGRTNRSDRTMSTRDMIGFVDSLRQSIDSSLVRLAGYFAPGSFGNNTPENFGDNAPENFENNAPASFANNAPEDFGDNAPENRMPKPFLATLPAAETGIAASSGRAPPGDEEILTKAIENARNMRMIIDDTQRGIAWELQRADRFLVEIHKKYSIAIACLIFMLIGAPLGLSTRRGGLTSAGIPAAGIFLFYWVTLVQGEKLADRGFLEPWIGMWIANLVMIAAGLWLMVYVTLDLRATTPLRTRLLRLLQKHTP